jgi:hypothetical protein
MKILFLHGWHSVPGGVKPTYLASHGHEVINPALDDDDFDAAVAVAQAEFDRHEPDVVVGSSRGGAVALNIDSGDIPLVLLCPAWKRWGTVRTAKPGTVILHSPFDETIPFEDSEELVENSGAPGPVLIETGDDHRLADPRSLARMLEGCWDDRYHAIHEASHAVVALRSGLKPKRLRLGRAADGTSGGVEFHSSKALGRDDRRFLMIAVAGCVGTRAFEYANPLVSEKLSRLGDEEPDHGSDEMIVWDRRFSPEEIEEAEREAWRLLEGDRRTVGSLSEALLARRALEKHEIEAIIGRPTRSRPRRMI